MKRESENLTKVLIVDGEEVSIKEVQAYHKNAIIAAFFDIFTPVQIAKIIENSIKKLCLQDSFGGYKELSDYLLQLVFEEANKIKPSVSMSQIMSLQICFTHFANFSKEVKSAIALSDESADYYSALEELDKFKHDLESEDNNFTAKIVDAIHRDCSKKFLDLPADEDL